MKQDHSSIWTNPIVERTMKGEWEESARKAAPDDLSKERIKRRLFRAINQNPSHSSLWFYKAAAVAACVIALCCATLEGYRFMYQEPAQSIMASGMRCIETLTLPDGTVVQLGPNSRISFPISFNGNKREVRLEGQAFFEVTKDPHKPFTVHTNNQSITALGTSFEVFDYDYIPRHQTILLEGSVKVTWNNPAMTQKGQVILSPNQAAVYNEQTQEFSAQSLDSQKRTAWREGVLGFENETLGVILDRLEGWCGQKVDCQESLRDKYHFTFKVKDESLELVLMLLQKTTHLKYKLINDMYYLYE